eukprot:13721962-Alexandrium_andersonii.AAC.3
MLSQWPARARCPTCVCLSVQKLRMLRLSWGSVTPSSGLLAHDKAVKTLQGCRPTHASPSGLHHCSSERSSLRGPGGLVFPVVRVP